MAIALLLASGLGYLALLGTVVLGLGFRWLWWPLAWHKVTGLGATLGLLLGHSLTLFYFIGTGLHAKELVGQHGLSEEFIERTRLFKKTLFPWVTLGMLTVMATFSLGGGVEMGQVPAWVHWGLALAALLVNGVALLRELFTLSANVMLFEEIAEALQSLRESSHEHPDAARL